jgi:uncharacterized protein
MTPQESQLVEDLFDRLAKLETLPRDASAERLIANGAQRAPHALYALVQTALLQDEALKRANARIEELEAQAGGEFEPQQRQGGSFLDSMRQAFGGGSPRGSVPSVRGGVQTQSGHAQPPGYPPQTPPGYAGAPGFGGGGSFLGTAASAAAGVIGGALLLDGIRSMFGHHVGGYAPTALGDFADAGTSPWTNTAGSAADSDLARELGVDHVGDHQGPSSDAQSVDVADDQGFTDADDFGSDDGGFGDDSYDA